MTIKEIRTFAKEKGFTLPIKATKEVLIHSIQRNEGNQACYAKQACNNNVCLWFKDCKRAFKNTSLLVVRFGQDLYLTTFVNINITNIFSSCNDILCCFTKNINIHI